MHCGGVCVMNNVGLFRSTFSNNLFGEMGFNPEDFAELDQMEDDEQCETCLKFNQSGFQFPTNHSTSDCLRCGACKTWMKTLERLHSHSCNGGKQPCKFFAGGYCKNGDNCDFAHGDHTQTQRLVKKQRNIFMREKCVFFGSPGGCKKGYDCPYKHGDSCSKCGGDQHDDRHCAQCYTCNRWGHTRADCPNKK